MKKDFVLLSEARPDLAREWNYEKNGDLKPEDVACKSNKKVWWKLPYDVPMDYKVEKLKWKHFEFEWEERINNRNRDKKHGCPYLSGNAIWPGFNDLQTVNPELAAQWHCIKNGNLKPTEVTANSNQKVWWFLQYDVPDDYPVESLRKKHFDFEWEATISSRNRGNGCPFLIGQGVWNGFNDLQTVNPELAKQWHPIKNGGLKPTQITANSRRKAWWLLAYDVPMDYSVEDLRGKHFDFEWQAVISSRNSGIGCPYLNGHAVWKGFNDLQTINPELASQWHPIKNKDLKPIQITVNSNKKVWWLLSYDVPMDYPIEHLRGRHFNFEWKATISKRNGGQDCPFFCGQAIWEGFNDLQTTNPEIASQWHPAKNGDLKPTQVTVNSKKRAWWMYPYDDPNTGKHFDFEWQASIADRNKNKGCPYFSGQAVWEGFNDLKTVNPYLAKLWHPTKNGKLKPTQVTINSTKRVWWMYPYDDPKTGKHFDFEWQSPIVAQNASKLHCPYLSNQAIWKGFNDLQTTNPRLATQWHPTKNGDLKPEQVASGSGRRVWWFLTYDDPKTGKHFNFEWQASINNRARGANCPFLITYRGENCIKQYLQKNNIPFEGQKKFSDLFGTGDGQLSYDFSISDEKYGHILIEYNGIQHYEANDYFGGKTAFKKQKEHDKRKRDYAKKHGYKLITVKYTYDTYESITEYLDKEFEKLGLKNNAKTGETGEPEKAA